MPGKRGFERGFSLIELMIALTIGLLLSGFMVAIIVNTSATNKEIDKSNRQIENGRYASELLREDVRLAGFYGDYGNVLPAAGALATVCSSAVADLLAGLLMPIQSFTAAAATDLSAACSGSLVAGSETPQVVAGTDVIIVRRADTNAVCGAGTTPAAPTVGDFYLQATAAGALEVQVGTDAAGGFAFGTTKADGTATELCKKALAAAAVTAGGRDNSCPTVLTSATVAIPANTTGACIGFTAAAIRKLHASIYYISPCNICSGSADSIPTLKRLRLVSGGFSVEPLVDGIEDMHIQFGVDSSDATDVVGFGSPDTYLDATLTQAQWANVVAVRLHVLARNIESTPGYTDPKTYVLGSRNTIAAPGGAYKRHAFSSLIRLENLAARREIPS